MAAENQKSPSASSFNDERGEQENISQDARREGRRPSEGRSEGRSEDMQRQQLSETDRRRERAASMRYLNRVRRMGGRK